MVNPIRYFHICSSLNGNRSFYTDIFSILPLLLTILFLNANIFLVKLPIIKVNDFYCRTFQTGLKLALPFLPYRKPKIVGSVNALPDIIKSNHCDKVLIITDAGIRKLGLTFRLEKALDQAEVPYCIYDKTVANPTTTNVYEAIALYKSECCDCIIGFGGGSSIDCAKAVGACIVKPKQPLSKMKGILKVHKKLPLLMAVPTTAGTGSDSPQICD